MKKIIKNKLQMRRTERRGCRKEADKMAMKPEKRQTPQYCPSPMLSINV